MKKIFIFLLALFWVINVYALDQELDKKEAMVWGFSNCITKGIITPEGKINALREFVYSQMKPDPLLTLKASTISIPLILYKVKWAGVIIRQGYSCTWHGIRGLQRVLYILWINMATVLTLSRK